jgi:apolipoprotein N-acyltransferase
VAASPYVLALASGLLYTFAFPPFDVVVLGWFVLTPLVIALQKATSARRAVLCGAIAASIMCMIGYFWIADTAHRFWGISWAFAVLLMLLYSTFGAINFTVFALLYWVVRRRLAAWPAAATAALFAGVELVTPKIFPDALGHTQTELPAFPLAAALVGAHGLSFLIAWVGAALAGLRLASSDGRRRRIVELVASVAVTLLLWAYGAARLRDEPAVLREIDLALVQTNIGDPVGLADQLGSFTAMEDSVLSVYMRATRDVVREHPDLDFIIWPETAVPLPGIGVELDPVRELVRQLPVPLIFGAYDFQRSPSGKWDVYNALIWMDTHGNVRDRYHKHKLIPLGETVPFVDRFPFLEKIVPASPGVFARGAGARVMEIEGVRFTPMICYELLFPRYVRRGLQQGDEVLLNLTNDYWFGRHLEPQQHLALARMRTFETGRPIVRATNTGISAIIDAHGRIQASAPLGSVETLVATLRVPAGEWTPFARWGEWLTLLLMALTVAAVAGAWRFVR